MSPSAQTRWQLLRHDASIGGTAYGRVPAYILASNGRIMKPVDLDCPDDKCAKAAAHQLVDGHDVELWQGKRKIETFKRPN